MGSADYLKLGSWNATCKRCGRKRKAEELARLPPGVVGAGLYVCRSTCWNPRHPQDFVRAIPDVMSPPWTQPPTDIYVFGAFLVTEQSNLSIHTPDWFEIRTENGYPITTEN